MIYIFGQKYVRISKQRTIANLIAKWTRLACGHNSFYARLHKYMQKMIFSGAHRYWINASNRSAISVIKNKTVEYLNTKEFLIAECPLYTHYYFMFVLFILCWITSLRGSELLIVTQFNRPLQRFGLGKYFLHSFSPRAFQKRLQ